VWSRGIQPAPFDKAVLEKQFALTSRAPPAARRAQGEPEQRKKMRVLDDRTSQLLAIIFSRLPPPEELASMIDTLEGFPEGLPSESVLGVTSSIIEQKEAIEQIRQLDVSDSVQLDMPEKYLRALGAVPFCTAKLTCSALIVGPASEVQHFRAAGETVLESCLALQKSMLVGKFLFTSLAVGNVLNRSTARSGAQGVQLPESLLKLEELHSIVDSDDPESKGPSVLDFVVQALLNEPGARSLDVLREECGALLPTVRAAQNVSLDESEASCRKVVAEAARAWQVLSEVPNSPGVNRVAEKVCTIRQDAGRAMSSLAKGKNALAEAFAWSSVKAGVKSDDWFAGWVLFLEQLSQALGRAKPQTQGPTVAVEAELPKVHRQPVELDDDARIEHLPLPQGDFWETAARAGKSVEATSTGSVHMHAPTPTRASRRTAPPVDEVEPVPSTSGSDALPRVLFTIRDASFKHASSRSLAHRATA
jgi:hypothetical protein